MKCPNCGEELPEDSLFCQFCGIDIKSYNATKKDELEKQNSLLKQETKEIPENVGRETYIANQVIDDKRSGKVSKIIAVAFLVLFIASVGVNAFQFFNARTAVKELKNNNIELSDKLTKAQDAVKTAERKVSELSESNAALKSDNSRLTKKASYYDAILEALSRAPLGYANSRFHASESIIIVNKGTTHQFRLTANWPNGGTVYTSAEPYGTSQHVAGIEFLEDNWDTSTRMSVDSWRTGVEIVTFSSDQDSQEFTIVIIVI